MVSPKRANAQLQDLHNQPRTCRLLWQWSTQLPGAPQISHRPLARRTSSAWASGVSRYLAQRLCRRLCGFLFLLTPLRDQARAGFGVVAPARAVIH